jgi:uncharacterized damage-inducible protein DinB
MPTSDPVEILLAHDLWATRQILQACEKLSPHQFHQPFEIGPGSLHDTITHMLAAMRTWTETLAGTPLSPRLEHTGQRTPAELAVLLDSITAAFVAEARRLPLSDLASRQRDGKTYRFTRSAILTHVATHGMHHRAQCLNMLRHLGVKPLPLSSVAEWSRAVDFPQC